MAGFSTYGLYVDVPYNYVDLVIKLHMEPLCAIDGAQEFFVHRRRSCEGRAALSKNAMRVMRDGRRR